MGENRPRLPRPQPAQHKEPLYFPHKQGIRPEVERNQGLYEASGPPKPHKTGPGEPHEPEEALQEPMQDREPEYRVK